METAVRVVTAMGAILAIVGLGWVLTGAFDYFAGRKNGSPQMMDQGFTSMISGGALAV
ncbi:hypothetical protein SAG0074_00275, partial [Streptococcus agalactiae CCUG 44186]